MSDWLLHGADGTKLWPAWKLAMLQIGVFALHKGGLNARHSHSANYTHLKELERDSVWESQKWCQVVKWLDAFSMFLAALFSGLPASGVSGSWCQTPAAMSSQLHRNILIFRSRAKGGLSCTPPTHI